MGNVLLNYRMFLLHKDAKYLDVAEVALLIMSLPRSTSRKPIFASIHSKQMASILLIMGQQAVLRGLGPLAAHQYGKATAPSSRDDVRTR